MTGRELIIYILQNHLEDVDVLEQGIFVGLMTDEEAAAKFDVGVSTVRLWHHLGKMKGYEIGNALYFLKNSVDPRHG